MIDKAKQTKEVFRDYIKLIAKLSKSKTIDCQAIIYSDSVGNPVLYGQNEDGYIMNDKGKLKEFTIREIIGASLKNTLSLLGIDLEKEIGDIIKKISIDEKMPFNGLNIRVVCTDDYAHEQYYFLFHVDNQIKELFLDDQHIDKRIALLKEQDEEGNKQKIEDLEKEIKDKKYILK